MASYRTRAGRRQPSGEYDTVLELALRPGLRLSPAQVYRELERRSAPRKPATSLRTVERILAELRPPTQDSELWTLLDADEPAEARAVLELIPMLRGRPTKVTAAAYVRVVRAVPDIDRIRAYYLPLLAQGERSFLEDYLAYAPWRDQGARLRAAIEAGFAPRGLLELDTLLDRMLNAARGGVASGSGAAYDATVATSTQQEESNGQER